MADYLFQMQVFTHVSLKRNPYAKVVEGGWIEDRVVEDDFVKLHKFVDLLHRKICTIV